jgi:hypothetical protein
MTTMRTAVLVHPIEILGLEKRLNTLQQSLTFSNFLLKDDHLVKSTKLKLINSSCLTDCQKQLQHNTSDDICPLKIDVS